MIRSMRFLISLPVILALAACGGSDPAAPGADSVAGIDHATGATDVVLQMSLSGGFVPVEYNLRSVPMVTIYGDGRVVADGPAPAIFPGPALYPLNEGRIDEATLQTLLAAIDDAGLNAGAIDFGQPPIADAPFTVLQLTTGGRTLAHSANALDITDGQGLTTDQIDARKRLSGIVAKVRETATTAATAPYVAAALSAWVGPYQGDPTTDAPVVWPLGSPLAADPSSGTGYGCIAVTGADVETLRGVLAEKANEATQWVAAADTSATFRVVLRPSLPHEQPCPAG